MTALFESFSQHGEDVVLWRALGHRTNIRYVDVGAFHPSDDSVTRSLYERGWRGVNIEPDPLLIALFDRDRPEDINVAAAIGDHDGTILLRRGRVPGWSTTVSGPEVDDVVADEEPLEVPLRRLDALLDELGIDRVDVLKVDVEGAEVEVVSGMLSGPVRPTVCVIEGASPVLGRGPGDESVRLLVGAGYQHCMFDGLNHWLTVAPDLVDALSVPANPLDGYYRTPPAAEGPMATIDPDSGEERLVARARPEELPTLVESLDGDTTPEQIVEHLFMWVLGRACDPEGARPWVAEIAGGADVVATGQRLALNPESLQRPLDIRLLVAEGLEELRAHRATTSRVEPGVAR